MEPEKPEAAAKQPMEAEAGDPVDPRELGDCLIPLASSASGGLSSYKPLSLSLSLFSSSESLICAINAGFPNLPSALNQCL